MILTITLNPCLDRTLFVRSLAGKELVRESWQSGGKGVNCARVLTRLGADTLALCALGGEQGRRSYELMGQEGIRALAFEAQGETRLIDTYVQPDYRQEAIFGTGAPLTASGRVALRQAFDAHLPNAQAVVIGGSGANEDDTLLLIELIGVTRAAGIPVWLDASGPTLARLAAAGPDLCKPNEKELGECIGREVPAWDGVAELPQALIDAIRVMAGPREVVLTLGEGGAIWCYDGGFCTRRPPWQANVNPVGSGDSFLAGLLYGTLCGFDRMESLRLACALGAANAAQWPAAQVGRKEAEALFGIVPERT